MPSKVVREFEYLVTTRGLEQAINSFRKTGKSAKGTADDISTLDRGLKSVAGSSKNSTSAFAKQAQGLGGLVHVYATVAANAFALASAFTVLKNSADLQIIADASYALSVNTGVNFARISEQMKGVTGGALGLKEAMQSTNIALAGGIDSKGLIQLTEIATKAAALTGRSVPEAVQRMVQAVVKAEPELIDEFGIILRVDKATEDYAKTLGKSAKELTTMERSQAILNQVLERGGRVTEGIQIEDAVNQFTRLGTVILDTVHAMLGAITGPLSFIASAFASNMGLVVTGIVLGLKAITSLAIPIIGKLGLTINTNLNEALATNSLEMEAVKAEAKGLAAAYAELEINANTTAQTLRKSLKGSGVPNIARPRKGEDKETALGRHFAELAKGDSKASSQLRKAFKKLESGKLEQVDTIAFKYKNLKNLTVDQVKQIYTLVHAYDDLANVQAKTFKEAEAVAAVSKEHDLRMLKEQELTKQVKIQALKQKEIIITSLKTAYNEGFSNAIINAKKATAAIKAETTKYSTAGLTGESFKNVFKNITNTAKQGITGIGSLVASAAGGIAKLAGKFISVTAIISILLPMLSAAATKIGLMSKAFSNANKSLGDMTERFETSKRIAQDMNKVVGSTSSKTKAMEDSVASMVAKYKRLSSATKELNTQFEETTKLFNDLERGTGLDKFIDKLYDVLPLLDSVQEKLLSITTDAALALANQISQAPSIIQSKLGDTDAFTLKLHVDDKTLVSDISKAAKRNKMRGTAKTDRAKLITDMLKENADGSIDVSVNLADTKVLDTQLEALSALISNSPKGERLLRQLYDTIAERSRVAGDATREMFSNINRSSSLLIANNKEYSKFAAVFRDTTPFTNNLTFVTELNKELKGIGDKYGKNTVKAAAEQRKILKESKTLQAEGVNTLEESVKYQEKLEMSSLTYLATKRTIQTIDAQTSALKKSAMSGEVDNFKTITALSKAKLALEKQMFDVEQGQLQAKIDKAKNDESSNKATIQALIAQKVYNQALFEAKQSAKELALELIPLSEMKVKLQLDLAPIRKSIAQLSREFKKVSFSAKDETTPLSDRLAALKSAKMLEESVLDNKIKNINIAIKGLEAQKELLSDKNKTVEADRVSVAIQKEKDKKLDAEIDKVKLLRKYDLERVSIKNKELDNLGSVKAAEYGIILSQLGTIEKKARAVLNRSSATAKEKASVFAESVKAEYEAYATGRAKLLDQKSDAETKLSNLSSIQSKTSEDLKNIAEQRLKIQKLESQLSEESIAREERILELRKEAIDLALKNVESIYSEESVKVIGLKFEEIANDFRANMDSAGERFVNSTITALDSSVDNLVDALLNGGNALQAITTTITKEFNNMAIEQGKDLLKSAGRNILANIFNTEPKLTKEQAELKDKRAYRKRVVELLEVISNMGMDATSTTATDSQLRLKPLPDSIYNPIEEGTFTIGMGLDEAGNSLTLGSGVLDKGFNGIGSIFTQGSKYVSVSLNNLISSLSAGGGGGSGGFMQTLVGGALSMFGGSIVSGWSDSFATASPDSLVDYSIQTPTTIGFSDASLSAPSAFSAPIGISSYLDNYNPLSDLKLYPYATGGIATSPQLALFGEGSQNEAFVPLPDGKTIPVTIKGGMGGNVNSTTTNNFEINISIDSDGNAKQSDTDSNKGKVLGDMIQAAITAELMKQKRPGGILA